jgi:hypothetical protein
VMGKESLPGAVSSRRVVTEIRRPHRRAYRESEMVVPSGPYFLVVKSISLGLYPPSVAFSHVQASRSG